MGGKSSPPPPDYTPVAEASKEATATADRLSRDQLDEARRQYDNNMAVAKPVVDAQLETMRQGIDQGKDYYEYGKSFRPLEQRMAQQLMADDGSGDAAERDRIMSEARANASMLRAASDKFEQQYGAAADALSGSARSFQGDVGRDIETFTGGNSKIMDKYGADINNDVGTAVADARTGQAQATNQAIRQALRYGLSVPASVGGVATDQASQIASAANNTRTNSINTYRGLIGQGIGMKTNAFNVANQAEIAALGAKHDAFQAGQAGRMDFANRNDAALNAGRNQRIQDTSLNWAKKLDVTGMARGMPGASTGAYGVAMGAGNSATQNQMAPGQSLLGAMTASNGTAMQGRGIAMQGLNGVLSAQTSYANANQGETFGSLLGGIGGLAAGIGKAAPAIAAFSDRRLKKEIVLVGHDENTGLDLYEFKYINGDGRRFVGVMADEVEKLYPEAVIYDAEGYASVNYGLLGLEMKEVDTHGAT